MLARTLSPCLHTRMDEPAFVAVPVLMAPWPRLEAVYADDLGVLPQLGTRLNWDLGQTLICGGLQSDRFEALAGMDIAKKNKFFEV